MKTGAAALPSLAAPSLKRAATAATGGVPASDFLHLIPSSAPAAKAAKTSKSAEANGTSASPASGTGPVAPAAKTDKAAASHGTVAASTPTPGDVLKAADGKPDSEPKAAVTVKADMAAAHEITHGTASEARSKPQAGTTAHDSNADGLPKPGHSPTADSGKAEITPKTTAKPDAGDAVTTAGGDTGGTPKTAGDDATHKASSTAAEAAPAGDSSRTPTEAASVPPPVTRASAKSAEKPKAERGDPGSTATHAKVAENPKADDTTAATAATEKTIKATPVAKPAAAPNGKSAAAAEPAAPPGEPAKIPAAVAAAFVAATGMPAVASATPATPAGEPAAPIAKAKTVRETPAPSKKEARAETGEKAKPETDRSPSTALADSSAKPADRQQAPAAPATDLSSRETAIARPPSDAGTPVLAADAKAGGDIRIHLPREASQPGATAPVVAVRVHAKDGITRAIEIRLDPADLGQVDVRLETGHDGRLRAVVQADNPQTFELLKREGGALEAALRDAGVQLGDDGLSFTLGDQGTGSDGAHQRERSYAGAAGRREDAIQDVAAATWRDGVIDISV